MTKTFAGPQQIQKHDKKHLQRLADHLKSIPLLPLSPLLIFGNRKYLIALNIQDLCRANQIGGNCPISCHWLTYCQISFDKDKIGNSAILFDDVMVLVNSH